MKPDELRALADEIEREGMTGALSAKFMRWRYPPPKYSLGHNDEIPLNLQDAVDAVPEGWRWRVETAADWKFTAVVSHRTALVTAEAASPAAALCAAILRAKAAEMEGE